MNKKILKLSLSQFQDYFNFAKSLWTVVYDSIGLRIIRNQKNLNRKTKTFLQCSIFQIRIFIKAFFKNTEIKKVKSKLENTISI